MSIPGRPLQRMFTTVPPRYDLVNRVVTWGMDRRWRDAAARQSLSNSPQCILDIGCGTGDLIIDIARMAGSDVTLVGVDYSQPMLLLAIQKARESRLDARISFVHADIAELPFPDRCFDCVGISFAFRNLTYKNPIARRHLDEVLRVLTPGGRYVIVESSQPDSRLIRGLFHLYLRQLVPRLGYWLSGNREAYRYLGESVADFYTPSEVGQMLRQAGFHQVAYRPLFFGAAGLHLAIKSAESQG